MNLATKSIIAALLAAAMICLSGCSNKPVEPVDEPDNTTSSSADNSHEPEDTSTESTPPESTPAESSSSESASTDASDNEPAEKEITIMALFEANKTENLLKSSDTIRIDYYEDDLCSYFTEVYYFNDKVAMISGQKFSDFVDGIYNGVVFSKNGEDSEFYSYYTEQDAAFFYEGLVADALNSAESIKIVSDNEDIITAELTSNYITETEYTWTIKFEKDTLRIIGVSRKKGDSIHEQRIFYNEERLTENMLGEWNGALKNVTLTSSFTYSDGSEDVYRQEFQVPAEWEYVNQSFTNAYMDESQTVPYEYPGDGVDLTVYLTNAMG